MNGKRVFLDTNVVLYLLSAEPAKAERAEFIVARGGFVSVQVPNEFAAVAARKLKLKLSWAETGEILTTVRAICTVVPLTLDTHERGLVLRARYGCSIYDAMILAAAQQSGCDTLLTEDLQHGQRIEGGLTVWNPFLDACAPWDGNRGA